MNIIIHNKIIKPDIFEILKQARKELVNGKLSEIIDKGANILISCPFHKGGHERHASCQVYADKSGDLRLGTFSCFTCHAKGSLEYLLSNCFDKSIEYAEQWLVDNFAEGFLTETVNLPMINISRSNKQYLNDEIINQYKYFHPYMFKRRLTEEVIRKFSIGYDEKSDCIVFPVWDEHNHLVMLTRRSVKTKNFYIDKGVEKPIYLLNFAIKEQVKTLYIVESQINCLTLWTYNYPAVALFGTGTKYQYDILNKCGIRHFIICLDGDEAGHKGTKKLIENLSKNCIVDVKVMKDGYDVNDLSKEDFDNLPLLNSIDWLKSNK